MQIIITRRFHALLVPYAWPTLIRRSLSLLCLSLFALWPNFSYGFVILTNEVKGEVGVYYWSNERMPIPYFIDGGETGISGVDKVTLVDESFQAWEDVPFSFVRFENGGESVADIDWDSINDEESPFLLIGDGQHEVIFDPDGEIVEQLGLDPETVLGFGFPVVEGEQDSGSNSGGEFTGEIIDGFILINTSAQNDMESVKATLVHEVGHFLGLGHSPFWLSLVAHDDNNDNNISLSEIDFDKVPTMFPFALPDDALATTLEEDDIAAISSLYPEPDIEEAFGAISGRVTREGGRPVFGASVIALRLDEQRNIVAGIGGLSGYKAGSPPPLGVDSFTDEDGVYSITGLLPGTYLMIIYPVSEDLIGIGAENIGLVFMDLETDFDCEFLRDVDCFSGDGGEIVDVVVKTGKTKIVNFTVNAEDESPEISEVDGSFPDFPYVGGQPRGGFPQERTDGGDDGCGCQTATFNDVGNVALWMMIVVVFLSWRTCKSR